MERLQEAGTSGAGWVYNSSVRKPKRKFRLDPRKEAKMEIPACKLSGLVVAFSLLTRSNGFRAADAEPSNRVVLRLAGPDPDLSQAQWPDLARRAYHLDPPRGPQRTVPGLRGQQYRGGHRGAVVLQTTDLANFDFAAALDTTARYTAPPIPYNAIPLTPRNLTATMPRRGP